MLSGGVGHVKAEDGHRVNGEFEVEQGDDGIHDGF